MISVMRLGACLSDALAVRTISLLRQGELCSCEIEAGLEASYAKLENALHKLRVTGLVKTTRRNKWLVYEIASDYSELIDVIWEAYANELEWDKELTFDRKRIKAILRARVDDFCPPLSKRSAPVRWPS